MIAESVGRLGINRILDVARVQDYLNSVPISEGGPVLPLPVNGFCGEQTKAAIFNFQVHQFGPSRSDGLVMPYSSTWKKMVAFQAVAPVMPVTVPLTDFELRPAASNERFYEVVSKGGATAAVYWMGFPPAPGSPPRRFEAMPVSFRAEGALRADRLECRATYTTRAVRGTVRSELRLMLPSGAVTIPVGVHLPTPSHTAVATIGGLFKRVA